MRFSLTSLHRRFPLACSVLMLAAVGSGLAQPAPSASAGTPSRQAESKGDTAKPPQKPADPVVAIVEGRPITLSQLGRATQALPENLRSLPFETLYPVLLDRIIDHEALVMMARRNGLEGRTDVQQDIQAATGRILEGAWLAQSATPKVTEEAIRARYNR